MKRILISYLCIALALGSPAAFGQALSGDAVQKVQMTDPQAAQAISGAVQRGDFDTAKKLYDEFLKKQAQSAQMQASPAPLKTPETSVFERTLSGDFPRDALAAPLHQFGYDIFLKTISTFAPFSAVPVGQDYVVGPGDQFTLTLWGTTEGIYNFQISREGNITLPKVGVVHVAGLRFADLENTLRGHLSKYYTNFNLSVAMGGLKSITVYVVGETANPGSYTLSSLTTVYGALFAAGGPTKKGTMRKIQILRNGKVVKTLDLYDFLLNGDRSQDSRLQNEDTVFVPLIGPVAGVAGTVYRPAIYELKGTETLGDLLQLAGGIMPIGLANRVQINRFFDHEKRIVMDVSLPEPVVSSRKSAKELGEKIQNMDMVSVFPLYEKIWETVNVRGDVRNPGNYQWRPDLKLREVVEQAQLQPTTDMRRAEVIRLTKDFTDRTILPVDLDALFKGDERQNIVLEPKDDIRIYTLFREVEKVLVSGEVLKPSAYEVFKGERLSDVLRRAGGFTTEAYPYGAVFKRVGVKSTQEKYFQVFITKMQSQILQVGADTTSRAINTEEVERAKTEATINKGLLDSLKAMQDLSEGRVAINITTNIDEWAGTKEDLLLQDGDTILIPKHPQEVHVIGEVNNAGAQIFIPGLKVKDYIANTGGVTKYADADELYVVKANGFAVSKDSPSVGNIDKLELNPGDAVFVPQKVERHVAWRMFLDALDVLFKTAVTIATLKILF